MQKVTLDNVVHIAYYAQYVSTFGNVYVSDFLDVPYYVRYISTFKIAYVSDCPKGAFIYYIINLGGRGGKPNSYVC